MPIPATTFDPSQKGASVTLSGSDLTATVSSGTGTARTTNKLGNLSYFEMTVGATLSGSSRIGLCNPIFTNTGLLGVDNNGVGYDAGGTVKINNATVATIATYTTSSLIGVAVDPMLKLVWFRVGAGGDWNNDVIANQNPVGAVGGISISALSGNFCPAWGGTATSSVTAAFASGSWSGTAPTGYGSPDTLGSSAFNADVAYRSATFSQYGPAQAGTPSPGSQISLITANRSVMTSEGAWYGSYKTYSPASFPTFVSGQVQENGSPVAGKKVFLYDHSNGTLIGTTLSDGSGNFSIPALGHVTTFAVALDDPTYNALVYDNVTPV